MDSKPTAFYLRYSAKDDADNISGQRELCQNWMIQNGENPSGVTEFAEDRQSAYKKPMAERPRWAALEREVRAGRIERIITRQVDRVTRRTQDMLDLIKLVKETGVQVVAVWSGGALDLSTPTGVHYAEMQASQAQAESAIKGQRVKAQKERQRAAGRNTGGPRPFGYVSGNGGLVPEEAELIAKATDAVLAGMSLHAVTRMFEESGLSTTFGKTWHKKTVRDILCRWRNAGHLSRITDEERETAAKEHRAIKDVDGGPSVYPAIVSLDTLHAVRGVLLNPDRKSFRESAGARPATLLSGLINCGVCGSTMKARTRPDEKTGGRVGVYTCTGTGCYTTIHRSTMDEMVKSAMVRFWLSVDVADFAPDDATRNYITSLRATRANLTTERQEVASMVGDGTINAAEGRTMLAGMAQRGSVLDEQIQELTRKFALAEALARPLKVGTTVDVGQAGALAQHFETQPLDLQRRQVEQVWRVDVRPRAAGRPQTFHVGEDDYRESVTEERQIERRAVFTCKLRESLSFDPVLEDLAEAATLVAEEQ